MSSLVSLELPDSLAQEIDRLAEAGHKQFTTYVAELLGQDVRLNRERKTLLEATGAWSDADHPELEDGGAAYVEKIRRFPMSTFLGSLIWLPVTFEIAACAGLFKGHWQWVGHTLSFTVPKA